VRRRTVLAATATALAGLAAGCTSGIGSSCTRGYSARLEPVTDAHLVDETVLTAPDTVERYHDHVLRELAAAPDEPHLTLARHGVTSETFLRVDGTYYRASVDEEERPGTRVTRSVRLPEGDPAPDVRFDELPELDREAVLASGAGEGLFRDEQPADFVRQNTTEEDPLRMRLAYPTTDPDPESARLAGQGTVLLGIDDAVVRLSPPEIEATAVEVARVRLTAVGETTEAVAARIKQLRGGRIDRDGLSAEERRFVEAATDSEQSACVRGSDASPSTPTPHASEPLRERLRELDYVEYRGQWYAVRFSAWVV
jgi:hypothetical protein